jgi:uncharacterized protein RhaS with RHS repeats
VDNHGLRYYDPEIGRYLTRDPIGYGDGMNVYLYVGGNPINRVDPLGLAFVDDLGESLHSPDRWYNQFAGMVHSAANGIMRAADNSMPNLPSSVQSAIRISESLNPFSLRSQVAATEHILTFPSRVSEIGSGSAEFSVNPTAKNALGVLTKDIVPAVEALGPAVGSMIGRSSAGPRPTGQLTQDGSASGAVFIKPEAGSVKASTSRKLQPNLEAEGPHTTFKLDPETGDVNHYETWQPQSNPQNPNPWESVKRYDATGGAHYNKTTKQDILTPHVHDSSTPGGVRAPLPEEIPK